MKGGTAKALPDEDSRFLERQMQAWLLTLSFPAYSCLIRLLLLRCGYSTVRALDTSTSSSASGRRCTGEGGLDLLAFAHTDLATFLSAVSLKTGRVPVSRRVVDELRGAMERVGAEQGILFATSSVSARTREVAGTSGLAPVHLFDGQAVAQMLIERRIGVKQAGEQWMFDAGFFEVLEQWAQGPQAKHRPS